MVKFWLAFLSIFLFGRARCQDYTIVPVNLAAQGNPQFLFFANATLINNSSSTIYLFMERFEKSIPANWSSCFCHPKCVAPFVDTISFSIAPYGQDSITPSFLADSIPGIGTVRLRLYQIGYEANADTITFTGSTLNWTSVNNHVKDLGISIYPNPCTGNLNIALDGEKRARNLYLYNCSGELIEERVNLTDPKISLSLKEYGQGVYFLLCKFENGTTIHREILVIK